MSALREPAGRDGGSRTITGEIAAPQAVPSHAPAWEIEAPTARRAIQADKVAEDPGPKAPAAAQRIAEVQDAVYRLLRYAASRSDIDLSSELIEGLMPAVRLQPNVLSPQDEVVLWDGYNRLSKLLAPATCESLQIADLIRQARGVANARESASPIVQRIRWELRKTAFFLIAMVLAFLITQAYVILLTDVVKDHEAFRSKYQSVNQQVVALRTASPQLQDHDMPLKPLVDEQTALERKIEVTSRAEGRLMEIWWWLYPRPEDTDLKHSSQEERIKTVIAIEGYARSLLSILSLYILPLILGLLGAIAYLVRRSLYNLANNSYTPNLEGQFGMRLCLGGLLGVISGIMLSLDQAELQTFNLSLVVVAFLMGYSVEFAFSVFDHLIDRGRALFKPEVRSSETPGATQATKKS